jgi:hypothetical protein
MDEINVSVKAITESGVHFWTWRAINDEIWCTKENILRKIKAPLQIIKMGIYHVPEIESYEDEFLYEYFVSLFNNALFH